LREDRFAEQADCKHCSRFR